MAESQGNGRGIRKKNDPSNRINRVLNYPGLSYFFDKNEQRYIRTVNGVAPDSSGDVQVTEGMAGNNSVHFLTINPSDWKIVMDRAHASIPYRPIPYVVDSESSVVKYKDSFSYVNAVSGSETNTVYRGQEGLTYTPIFWQFRYDLPDQYSGKIVRCLGSTISEMPRLTKNSSQYADLSAIQPELHMFLGRTGTTNNSGRFSPYAGSQYSEIKAVENSVFLCKTCLQNELWGNGFFDYGYSFENAYESSPPELPSVPLTLMLVVEDPELPAIFVNMVASSDMIIRGYQAITKTTGSGERISTRLYLVNGDSTSGAIYNTRERRYVYSSDDDYALLSSLWKAKGYRTFYNWYDYNQVLDDNGSVFSETMTDNEVRQILRRWGDDELTEELAVGSANKLANARQITLAGDVDGDAMFDGSEDITIGTTVDCLSTTEIDDLMEQSMALGG